MAIDLQNPQNISTGWGPPPKFDAPAIGGVLGEILQQRRMQQALQQRQIADTIKNVQEERQSAAYLAAMKKAGLIPEDYDAGGAGGARYGTTLATMIERKRREDAMEAHRKVMETRVGGRGGRGSRGDDGVTQEVPASDVPEDYYGLSVAPGAPSQQTSRTVNGIVQVRKAKGRWETAPKWMQPQGSGAGGGGSKTNLGTAVKERLQLMEETGEDKKDIAKEEAANIKLGAETKDPKYKNVPFSRSDEYNLRVNRLKQLEAVPGMPSTEPAIPQRAPAETGDALPTSKVVPSDKAGGHADTYGVQGVKMQAPDGTVKTVAPDQVDYYKAKGAVIVP